jgi:PhoH-like ATPase
MGPIFDNLRFLLKVKNGEKDQNQNKVQELQDRHILELEALTYIRGRSITRQFMIVDEAQNLTPHEVKTIVSRAGEGTKIVLTGDPYQIDNPYLDASSNGLSYVVERLKSNKIHGHVTLTKSERGSLAAAAIALL